MFKIKLSKKNRYDDCVNVSWMLRAFLANVRETWPGNGSVRKPEAYAMVTEVVERILKKERLTAMEFNALVKGLPDDDRLYKEYWDRCVR